MQKYSAVKFLQIFFVYAEPWLVLLPFKMCGKVGMKYMRQENCGEIIVTKYKSLLLSFITAHLLHSIYIHYMLSCLHL